MPARKPPATDATLAALYKAVLASPDDDLPRLVYADRQPIVHPFSDISSQVTLFRCMADRRGVSILILLELR